MREIHLVVQSLFADLTLVERSRPRESHDQNNPHDRIICPKTWSTAIGIGHTLEAPQA